MKRLATILSIAFFFAVLAASIIASGPASAAGDVTAAVGAAAVNVRQGPGTGYPLIGVLPARAKATVLAFDPVGGWLQIPFDLADVAVNSVSPAWSPDGKYIAHLTDERGRWELYRMKADGSEKGPFLEDALKGITFEYNSVDERVITWGK